jgi:hypothetical protein
MFADAVPIELLGRALLIWVIFDLLGSGTADYRAIGAAPGHAIATER